MARFQDGNERAVAAMTPLCSRRPGQRVISREVALLARPRRRHSAAGARAVLNSPCHAD